MAYIIANAVLAHEFKVLIIFFCHLAALACLFLVFEQKFKSVTDKKNNKIPRLELYNMENAQRLKHAL